MDPSEKNRLIQQLDVAKQQASYWKQIAKQTGQLRLREAENLSAIIQALKQTKERLANEINERKQAEATLAQRLEFERLVSEISSELLGMSPDKIDAGIKRSLASIGTFSRADRAYVFQYREDGELVDNTHEWCAKGVVSQRDNFTGFPLKKKLPFLAEKLRTREVLHLPNVNTLPPEAWLELEHLKAQNILSLIVVPMKLRDRLVGFLGFDAVRESRIWAADDQAILRLVGEAFTNAIVRKRAEEELRLHSLTLSQIEDRVVVTDLKGNIKYINNAVCRTLGKPPEELLGQNVSIFGEDRSTGSNQENIVSKTLQEGRWRGEVTNFHSNGSEIFLDSRTHVVKNDAGQPIALCGISTDITGRKLAEREKANLESQLRQAQKMEAIGTLAGGIAHDFNNILAAISGYSELALYDALEGNAAPNELKEILKAADRAKKLIQQILSFSRKTAFEYKPFNLNEVISDAVTIIERTIPKMISLELHLEQDLQPINGDPNQIQQVLLNLASNTSDAMPDGGKLVIETTNVSIDEQYANGHIEASSGDYVLVAVSDTGIGMDKDTLEHIFEPFYTTKEIGKGTGLGLASVYGIVKGHGGYITCYSEPEEGATFKIYFPILKSGSGQGDNEEALIDNIPGGTETVLLVDDEETLRDLGSRNLQSKGYQVMTASSGEEALDIYRLKGRLVDLVIMDLGMPGMGGRKALKEILSIDPQAKVIIVSGYLAKSHMKAVLESGALEYVTKPYKQVELLYTIKNALDKK